MKINNFKETDETTENYQCWINENDEDNWFEIVHPADEVFGTKVFVIIFYKKCSQERVRVIPQIGLTEQSMEDFLNENVAEIYKD